MKDDAGRIDDAPQRVALVLVDLFGNCAMEPSEAVVEAGNRVFSLLYLLLDTKKHGAGETNHGGVRFGSNDGAETGIEQEIIERGQQAVQAVQVGIAGRVLAVLHALAVNKKSMLTQENGRQTLSSKMGT